MQHPKPTEQCPYAGQIAVIRVRLVQNHFEMTRDLLTQPRQTRQSALPGTHRVQRKPCNGKTTQNQYDDLNNVSQRNRF